MPTTYSSVRMGRGVPNTRSWVPFRPSQMFHTAIEEPLTFNTTAARMMAAPRRNRLRCSQSPTMGRPNENHEHTNVQIGNSMEPQQFDMQISTGKRKVEHLRGEPRICFDTTTADDGGDQQCQCQTHPLGGHRFHIWVFRACGLRAQGLLILNFQTSSNSLLPAFQTRSSRAPTENHIRSFRLRVLNDTKRPLLCAFRRPIIHTFHK